MGGSFVIAIVYLVVYAVSFLWVRIRGNLPPSDSSVVALTLAFPNSAAVGLPLLSSAFGAHSTVSVAIPLAIGCVTISPITLAILEVSRRGDGGSFALSNVGHALMHSIKQPIVWSPLLGVGFSYGGVHLPSFIHRSIAVMGAASDASVLVLTGLVVSAQKFEIGENTLAAVFLKNALQPSLPLGIGLLIHLPVELMRYIILISAMPCGFFGVVFGKGYDSSPKLASSGLIASYVIGIGTLAAWIVIVNHLG